MMTSMAWNDEMHTAPPPRRTGTTAVEIRWADDGDHRAGAASLAARHQEHAGTLTTGDGGDRQHGNGGARPARRPDR